jgi:hypothetical protein
MSQRCHLPIRFRALVGGALIAGVLLPLGAGVADAEPTTSSAPACVALAEAEDLVAERQDALDEAIAAYNRQKTVRATALAEYERLQADEDATAAEIEDARITAQRASERLTRLFAAQAAAGRALDEAVRARADARRAAEGADCPGSGSTSPEPEPNPEPNPEPDPRPNPNPQPQPSPRPVPQPTVVNRPVIVTQHTHIHPTSVYLYNGGRWVVYSDGTAVRCGSEGRDVERVEVVETGTEQGVPSAADVQNAGYPVGGVEAGDGSDSAEPIVAVAAGALALSAAGTGAYAWHRRRGAVR